MREGLTSPEGPLRGGMGAEELDLVFSDSFSKKFGPGSLEEVSLGSTAIGRFFQLGTGLLIVGR